MAFLITNVRIFDGTGREPFAGAVRVEGERIAEVIAAAAPSPRSGGSAASPAAAPGTTVIDGAGATLMPGLVECHAHLGLADMASLVLVSKVFVTVSIPALAISRGTRLGWGVPISARPTSCSASIRA